MLASPQPWVNRRKGQTPRYIYQTTFSQSLNHDASQGKRYKNAQKGKVLYQPALPLDQSQTSQNANRILRTVTTEKPSGDGSPGPWMRRRRRVGAAGGARAGARRRQQPAGPRRWSQPPWAPRQPCHRARPRRPSRWPRRRRPPWAWGCWRPSRRPPRPRDARSPSWPSRCSAGC